MVDVLDLLSQANEAREAIGNPNNMGLQAQTGRALCNAHGANPAVITGGLAAIGSSAVPLNYMCGKHWQNNNYSPPVENPPSITGGQCAGVMYRVVYLATSSAPGAQPTERSQTGMGPISGATFGCGRPRPGITSSELALLEIGFADDPVSIDLIVAPGTCLSFVRTERLDGAPDDCGNLPPTVGPGANPPPSLPFNQPFSWPVFDTPGDITIRPPQEDPLGGGPSITVDTPFGPVTFAPGPNLPVDPPEPPIPPVPGSPIQLPQGGGSGSVPPVDPEGRTCVGFEWVITDVVDGASEIPDTNPVRFYEVVGSMQLRLDDSTGGGNLWSTVTRLDARRGSVYRGDGSLQVSGYSANIRSTFGRLTLTPIYAVEVS